MQLSLAGRTALVCGASQGIGRAAAVQLATMGARVLVLARNEKALATLVEELSEAGGEGHRALTVDVTDREALSKRVNEEIKKRPIEILINNTGGPKGGPILGAQDEEFLSAFSQHILVASRLSQLVVPGMKISGYGRIINVISTSVKVPIPGLGVSNTVRGAMASWAKTLSLEVGAHGITVNNVLPGYTETPRLESLLKATSEKQNLSVEQVSQQWRSTIPLGRFARSSEVAAAIGFLASPAASYISGVSLPVDGGRTGAL